MWKSILTILLLATISTTHGWGQKKMKLEDVNALTLQAGHMTTGRRSSPVPQLNCIGGYFQNFYGVKMKQVLVSYYIILNFQCLDFDLYAPAFVYKDK